MSILYYLVGIPASGKTTWAKNIKDDIDAIHISSDDLRVELYGDVNNQEHNSELFQIMNKRTKELLKIGHNVIYDATNINSRKRTAFLKELNRIDCKKICIYFATSINSCDNNDSERDRQVGFDVIDKMYRNLQIPMYHEGWDDIRIIGNKKTNSSFNLNLNEINNYDDYIKVLDNVITKQCINYPQDSQWHTLSVSRHMYYVYKYIKEINGSNDNLIIASMLHDIGKPYCKQFKEGSKYANFYNHENVSSQLAVRYLLKAGFNDSDIMNIATYIQLHMKILNIGDNIKTKEKLIKNIGLKLYKDLELLRNADISAK